MNYRDEQTESSRTESRSVQFQSSLKSVSLDSSTVSNMMEENEEIDQPAQKYSSKCEKYYCKEVDSIAELREITSAMKIIISEQQKRNKVLEDVVVGLCDQMRYVIERLPESSAEERATMQAALNNSIDQLSDVDKLSSAALRVNGLSTSENADEISRAKVDLIENEINSNLELADIEINSSLRTNEIGNDMLNGEISIQTVQEHCDVAQEEVLEIQGVESKENSSNENVDNVDNCQPLVYHLSEKHGPSGSKTLRINIAPTREQHHPHIGRLTKSAFSSSFSTLPNATSTQVRKKSKSRYERTNSLQSLSSSVSLDDLDWPDTDKILQELEVIKEMSVINLAMESNENKLTADRSKTLDGQSGSSLQASPPDCPAGSGNCPADSGNCHASSGNCPADSGNCPADSGNCPVDSDNCLADSGNCPAGSGHCDLDTDPKSPFAKNLPPNENCSTRGGAVDLTDSSARQVTNSILPSNNIPSGICDGPHDCAVVYNVTEVNCNEKCLPINVTNILQCESSSSQSTSKNLTSEEDVPQSNSPPATNCQKASKASSKRRRRKRLSKSESVSKSGAETENVISKNLSSENESSRSTVKSDTAPSKSDEPIIVTRREAKNQHSSSSVLSSNAGYGNNNQNNVPQIDVSKVSSTSNSLGERMPLAVEEVSKTSPTKNEVSNMISSVTDSNGLPSLVKAECNNASQALERDDKEHLPKELITMLTSLEESEKGSFLSTEVTFNLSLEEENTTVKEFSTTELCTAFSPSMETRSHTSSTEKATNNSPLATDVSCKMSSLSSAISEPSSLENSPRMEASANDLSSKESSKPEINSIPSAINMDVVEIIPSKTDVTASCPSLTEVASVTSECRSEDAKCGKVSDGREPSRCESPGIDQHKSGPSQFSPEAKEFEPTREYGKAKLLLSPEVSKDAKNKTRCPKLTSTCMEQDSYSPPSEEKQGSCAECGTSTSQRCSNCRQVFYCKRDCQREHWKKGHKSDCKPFKVEKNSTLGRYLVATRDFKAGDIIFKDEPLFVGPKQITEPVCLGCYKRVDGSYRCSKCTWPMCGRVCETSPDHQPECVVGKVMGSPIDIQDFNDTNHFYEVVSPLRGLALKKRAPKKYEELLELESHFKDRVGTHAYNENQKRVVNMLKNYFMLVDFPSEDIDASDRSIHQVTGIIDVNTVEIPLEETDIIGIYPTYSMLEHSCTPNTKYRVSPLYQLTLRAAVNIRQGEHLSTIYTHMLWGTAARRDCLKSTRYFMCTCRRCADPTELGTNFSALRCPKCPLGFMMSAAPLDQLADWICTSCNSTMTGDDANDITLQLGEEVEMVLANARVKDLEDFIERSSATIVHPNHFHLFAARHSLLQMLGREKPGLDEEAVKKKEKMCQEFLKTCTALDPGMCKLSSYAGVALYEYHLAVMARTRQGPTDQQVDKIALRKDLDTAKALLQQCIKVLQEEPSEKPEGQLRNLAEQNLQELSQWESP